MLTFLFSQNFWVTLIHFGSHPFIVASLIDTMTFSFYINAQFFDYFGCSMSPIYNMLTLKYTLLRLFQEGHIKRSSVVRFFTHAKNAGS